MRKLLRLLSLTLAILFFISSTLSSIAFADTYEDFNDFTSVNDLEFKVDPPKSIKIYFDEVGKKTDDTDSIYWIEFTLSEDKISLSFKTNNVSLDKLAIKGGDGFRLYSDLGSSGSGYTSPDNNGGQAPEISHFSFDFTIKIVEIHASVKVIKEIEDYDDESLAGFVFELHQNGERIYGPKTTDEDGYAIFKEVDPGTYNVIEVLTNEQKIDYKPAGEVTVTVGEYEEGQVKVTFINKKIVDQWKGKIIVQKEIYIIANENARSSNGSSLMGFHIQLWQGNKMVDEDYTDIYGKIVFDGLEAGTYEIKEVLTDSPTGYRLDSISNNGIVILSKENNSNDVFLVTVTNQVIYEWLGKIRVIKRVVDEKNSNPNLSGFVIELWKGTEKIAQDVTDGDGEVEFRNLSTGDYTIKEILGNLEDVYNVNIENAGKITLYENNDNDNVFEITVTNIKDYDQSWDGSIRVEKTVYDEESRGYLENKSGFTFILYNIVGNEEVNVDEAITGLNGIVTFSNKPEGTYVIREKARSGYKTDFDREEVGLFEEGYKNPEVVKVTNTKEYNPPNEKEKSRINVEKVVLDEDGNVIENDNAVFTFELFRKVAGEWRSVETKTIEGNGTVQFRNLTAGTYMIEEINIHSDYNLDSVNKIEIKLSEGETDKVEFTNIKEKEKEKEKEEDKQIEIVIEEKTPEAPPEIVVPTVPTLPKTGSSSPLVSSGLGSILLGLGLFLKKKE